ncbi:E3 ubiquitin-protein ligase SMURF2 [Collichthys lucidus]|uniref:E3 ubiquitin-protein ligase SMURF2 n=1 Tax=Collichthys lucidus TaxID=240159 RepID=A0A4U5VSP7_COLLU|nr:E3 ubiquitin-protein ligase SMURF2 [Collichthys lucidus]
MSNQGVRRNGPVKLRLTAAAAAAKGAVEDFTRLDDSLLGTLCHTEWKDRVMYCAGATGMPLKIAIVAWFPTIRSRK